VDNYQTMTISHSLFTGNSAVGGPMGDSSNSPGQAQGGGILTGFGLVNNVTVILTISDSLVTGNLAIAGSGGSTLAYPRTETATGGGIFSFQGGTVNVAGCTITGNQAIGGASAQGSGGPAFGGGIQNSQATLNLTDSTVSANLCQGGTLALSKRSRRFRFCSAVLRLPFVILCPGESWAALRINSWQDSRSERGHADGCLVLCALLADLVGDGNP
jgi:hypothetical protein